MLRFAILALVAVSPTGNVIAADSEGPAVSPTTAFADANADFGFDLFRAIEPAGRNAVLSPHSIAVALAMARSGAAGETARQMDQVLRLQPDASAAYRSLATALAAVRAVPEPGPDGRWHDVPAYVLAIANGLFCQEGWSFREAFRRRVTDDFGAEFRELDFGRPETARSAINQWAEDKTQKRIKDLVSPGILGADTRMVLANAIHLKASWAERFPEAATEDAPFFVAPGRSVTTPRMRKTADLAYSETPEAQVVEIPYRGDDTGMLVVLPKEKDGLDALVRSFSGEKLRSWTTGLRARAVSVELPRFTFTWRLELRAMLEKLGMTDAFDANKADFTGIATDKSLFIGAVLHKAFVAVDEKGTEAAAATAVEMEYSSVRVPAKPIPFVADHPFLFLLRHEKTGTILFLGQVVDPTAK